MGKPDEGLLPVRVVPRAGRDEVVGWRGDALRVRVAAAPEAGRANRAVALLLSEVFGVPRVSVELVRGAAARDKLYRIGRHSLSELRQRLRGSER